MGSVTDQYIDDEYLHVVVRCSRDPWYIKLIMLVARFMQKHRVTLVIITGLALLFLLAYFAFAHNIDPAIFALGVLFGLFIGIMILVWLLMRN